MDNEGKRIVEIDGVKLEVDLRTARVIDHYKIGDPVRVLTEDTYDNIKAGVIVGFCEFEKNPAIEIMVLNQSYSGADFRIVTVIGGKENKIQIAPYDKYQGLICRTDIVTRFDRQIEKAELDLAELKLKKKYFIDDFAKAFGQIFSEDGAGEK